ncbi:MAG: PQQ-binding-like beta-propeller repeat protein [Bacteroidales bacterium]|nr:PQQ-binding-like beta-propeller repeat protein [Bacteroidales bacterium]
MYKKTFFFVTALISAQILIAQPYSEWREENRTGVSSETGLLKAWPEAGPGLLWTNTDLPKGYSSVSFGKESIFVTGIEEESDVLLSLDMQGNINWKITYGRAWTDSYPDSRCTPTVDGNQVYVSSGFGDLACLNAATGRIIWSSTASETFKGTYGPWGIAESLIIDGDKLYFTPGGPETTTIALNKHNGELIWKTESLNDNPGYVSPVMYEYAGKNYLANVSGRYVFAVDLSDGTIAWSLDHMQVNAEKAIAVWPDAPAIKCVTPLFYDGQIYITGGYDHGSFMLDLSEKGDAVSLVWTDSVLDVHHGGVVLLDGYLYGSNWLNNSNGNWCCLDWETGKKMYEESWKCKGSVIAAEGMLYIYDEKRGNVGLVKATPGGFELISSFRIEEGSGPHWAHPVIHKGHLYIRHGNALMAYKIGAI